MDKVEYKDEQSWAISAAAVFFVCDRKLLRSFCFV